MSDLRYFISYRHYRPFQIDTESQSSKIVFAVRKTCGGTLKEQKTKMSVMVLSKRKWQGGQRASECHGHGKNMTILI